MNVQQKLDRAVEKLAELAEECAECGGTAVTVIGRECGACHDIRLVIHVCTTDAPTSQPNDSGEHRGS